MAQIARKMFEFAKSLGVETLASSERPSSAGDREAADELGVNVALGGSAKTVARALQGRSRGSACTPISASGRRKGRRRSMRIALLNDRLMVLKLSENRACLRRCRDITGET
jgi:hypothetical protein